ncbi:MAG: hypothetical protein ACYTFW_20905 [Planctomycetota bacterium]|jgi:hypothetical protein
MERQVEKYIQGLSDIDLLEYTRTDTHLPEALMFAKVELAERHLNSDRLAALDKQLQQRQKAREEAAQAAAAEPLHWKLRLAVFLSGLCFGIPLLLFVPAWLRFRKEGAHRKYKDMWVYALVGFCLQPILICLRIPPWSWVTKLF